MRVENQSLTPRSSTPQRARSLFRAHTHRLKSGSAKVLAPLRPEAVGGLPEALPKPLAHIDRSNICLSLPSYRGEIPARARLAPSAYDALGRGRVPPSLTIGPQLPGMER